MKARSLALLLSALAAGAAPAIQPAPQVAPSEAQIRPAWTEAQVREILDKTQTIELAPDLSHLSAGEGAAMRKLIEVGEIFQAIYEQQRHRSALAAREAIRRMTANLTHVYRPPQPGLGTLYRLFQGPIATTLDNRREPFVTVEEPPPGKNVYPWDLTRTEWDAFLARHPNRQRELLDPRSVVRRAELPTLRRDLAMLDRYPVLDVLHPGLRQRLVDEAGNPDRTTLYALPYSVAYADETMRAYRLLNEAADHVETSDAEFAGYLRNRARDLLSDDYESGDAAWITGRFRNLNAQIGAYETYDDELIGTRAFYSLSVLATRGEETAALQRGMQGLQAIEDVLPYDRRKRIREDIPVGVYDVIADFGQARGGNTASILPNDPLFARRYGRTILMRANILRSPEIFGAASGAWQAVVAPQFAGHLTADAAFHRTLWHEVGHYLGVDRTRDGRELDAALGANANLLEEMKADLVSLFAGPELARRGYFTPDQLRSHYASGIHRTLQNVRPRRDQPYQTMQLMQFNWFLERGVLSSDPASQRLAIDYERYPQAVTDLLREVLALQDRGDEAAADAFITRLMRWDEALHGRLAERIRAQQRYRYRLFTYAFSPR
ncbi:MAG: NUDIX hydrolase [Pseudomonadota bacterium]|nr:NUDIX hydrolase [Pseudomonadota bacterium]